jgi:thiamine biosynthesis lipoprotein
LRKTHPDVHVDLSGIAKGFAVDAIAELVEQQGITRFMIEIGGEVRTGARKQDGAPWRIGIESPVSVMRGPPQEVVELEDLALATSGDYRNYFERDGRRYSHTIDPRKGRPIEHNLASVSIVAPNCMFADAMATALTVMGPDDAFRYARENDLDVLLIIRETDGFVEKVTDGFSKYMARKTPER